MEAWLYSANLSLEKFNWCNGKAVWKRKFEYFVISLNYSPSTVYVIYGNIGPTTGEWTYFQPLFTSSESLFAQTEFVYCTPKQPYSQELLKMWSSWIFKQKPNIWHLFILALPSFYVTSSFALLYQLLNIFCDLCL